MHHHAMNLVQPHTTVAASDPVHVIVYQQNDHQQQPISYKIPQLGTVIAQDQTFVVNDQGGQLARQQHTLTTQANARLVIREVFKSLVLPKDYFFVFCACAPFSFHK
jgi:hypothetical protein